MRLYKFIAQHRTVLKEENEGQSIFNSQHAFFSISPHHTPVKIKD